MKKNLFAAPPVDDGTGEPVPDQPIKAETLKRFWVDFLENRSRRLEFIEQTNAAQAELGRAENELNDRVDAAFRHAKVDRKAWQVNFKAGVMTKIPIPPA